MLETEFDAPGERRCASRTACPSPTAGPRWCARAVEGLRGRVEMSMELVIRFDYGRIMPLGPANGQRSVGDRPALTRCCCARRCRHMVRDDDARGLKVAEGDRLAFLLSWYPSAERPPGPLDVVRAVADTERWWVSWSERCTAGGRWHEAVKRSLITLKALTYGPTGGIDRGRDHFPARAGLGGVRNWDYRYCWLHDASARAAVALHRRRIPQEAAKLARLLSCMHAVAGGPRHPDHVRRRRRTAARRARAQLAPRLRRLAPVRIGNATANRSSSTSTAR